MKKFKYDIMKDRDGDLQFRDPQKMVSSFWLEQTTIRDTFVRWRGEESTFNSFNYSLKAFHLPKEFMQ